MIKMLAGRHRARVGLGALGVGILVLALVPAFATSYYTSVLGQALAFAMFAISLDLIWGISGVLSFGHAAFFGIGAYAFGLLTQDLSGGTATYIAVLAALVIPALFGAGLGYFTFFSGVTGPYFAIITLTVVLILGQAATSFPHFTGGLNGVYIPGLVFQTPGGEINLSDVVTLYYVALFLTVLTLFGAIWLVRTPFGQALVAAGESEMRAASLGYNTALLKTAMLAISGAIAGLAGALYAPMASFINPDVVGLTLSTNVIIWVALGGRGVLIGGVVGALVIAFLSSYLSGSVGHVWLLALGVLLLLVVLFRPSGLLGSRAIRRIVGSA
jgi:ABC-type branched-subunit amino acid transport system permease subunit